MCLLRDGKDVRTLVPRAARRLQAARSARGPQVAAKPQGGAPPLGAVCSACGFDARLSLRMRPAPVAGGTAAGASRAARGPGEGACRPVLVQICLVLASILGPTLEA